MSAEDRYRWDIILNAAKLIGFPHYQCPKCGLVSVDPQIIRSQICPNCRPKVN